MYGVDCIVSIDVKEVYQKVPGHHDTPKRVSISSSRITPYYCSALILVAFHTLYSSSVASTALTPLEFVLSSRPIISRPLGGPCTPNLDTEQAPKPALLHDSFRARYLYLVL